MGHFYEFLKNEKKININYIGIDISEKMIKTAKYLYPDTLFQVEDIYNIEEKYDFVVESGVFNTLLGSNKRKWRKNCENYIKKMYDLCKVGIAFNFLTTHVQYRDKILFYANPGRWFDFAKKFSKYVVLRHDYPLYDFTIYMYKRIDL